MSVNNHRWVKAIWSIQDEAIMRGNNYANHWVEEYAKMDAYVSTHARLKQAYQEGFLHGFEHKFDQHNYEQTDNQSISSTTEEK